VGTSELIGQQIMADEMLYALPGYTMLEPSRIFRAEWSEDGRMVRFRLFEETAEHILEIPEP